MRICTVEICAGLRSHALVSLSDDPRSLLVVGDVTSWALGVARHVDFFSTEDMKNKLTSP